MTIDVFVTCMPFNTITMSLMVSNEMSPLVTGDGREKTKMLNHVICEHFFRQGMLGITDSLMQAQPNDASTDSAYMVSFTSMILKQPLTTVTFSFLVGCQDSK